MSQLGVVLTPYGHVPGSFPAGITRSYAGATAWAPPFDPQFYSRGEAGYYYDTQLGGSPTDFELARRRGYLPVASGWTTTRQGYQPGGWLPPDGGYPGQPQATRYPMVPLNGLGGDIVEPGPATANDVMAIMAAHNDRVFALGLVSTVAVTISALLGLFRTLKLIHDDART
jgi:hypothetical protein